jgi:hypothetical protein
LTTTSAALRAASGGGGCTPNRARLVAAYRETWLAFVQREMGMLYARARDELPILDALYRATRDPIPSEQDEALSAMDDWYEANLNVVRAGGLWQGFSSAMEDHVASWRPVLEACGALPAAP